MAPPTPSSPTPPSAPATPPSGGPAELPTTAPVPASLLAQMEAMSPDELDGLPYGMIQLDRDGRILKFNKTEANLARLNRERQLGRSFFDEVAPCTKVREFYGRFQQGLARRSLYETFGFVFKFEHGWRNVAITLFYSDKTDSVWVLVSQKSVDEPRRPDPKHG